MKRTILTLLAFLLVVNNSFAQENESIEQSAEQSIKTEVVDLENSEDPVKNSNSKKVEEEEEGYAEISSKKYNNYFGLCSGLTYKYGISYRRWFMEDNFALQLHIFPLIMRTYDEYDDEYYTEGRLKVGLTFLKGIKSYKYVRLLYFLNGTLSYDVDYDYNYDWVGNTYESEYEQTEELSVGVATGPGFEFYFWRFSMDVFLGVSGRYNLDTEEYFILPAAETALHFRF